MELNMQSTLEGCSERCIPEQTDLVTSIDSPAYDFLNIFVETGH